MASASYPNSGQHWQQQQQQQQHHEPQHQQVASISPPIASPVLSKETSVVDENRIVMDYKPPGIISSPYHPSCNKNNNANNSNNENNHLANKKVQWVYNPLDGSVLTDHNGAPLSVDRLLNTKPLRHELSTRPGPGNKKLTYISGDDVSRTLNDIFGFDGWNLDIVDVTRVDASRDPKNGKHTVVYTAKVRVTHKASGAYKEDCGAGDSTDKIYGTAVSHALKSSITDAMKRAARHFGDKLGNSLYSGNFSQSKAPVSLKDALDKYDIHRCNTKFGFQQPSVTNKTSATSKVANSSTSSTSASTSLPSVRSMPPPIASFQASRQKVQQQEQPRNGGAPLATTNSIAGKDKNIAAQQYQNHRQPQQPHQHKHPQNQNQKQGQHEGTNTKNSHSSTVQGFSNQAYSTNSHPPNFPGSPNNYRQQQKHGTNFDLPSSNRIVQPQPASKTGSNSTGMPTSDISRPTSSYGRRPILGSNNPINTSHSGNGSSSIATTTTVGTGPSFHPNSNSTNTNNHRVSLDQKNIHPQQQRQPVSTHTPHSSMSNVNTNVHKNMVSQTPSTHGGGSGSGNSCSNPHHKRKTLGDMAQNPTAIGFSSESSSKRPKQLRHHNPYNQSLSGRKSI